MADYTLSVEVDASELIATINRVQEAVASSFTDVEALWSALGILWERRESERMEGYLTDLAVDLSLRKNQVAEMRRIINRHDWQGRLALYLLAGMVKEDCDFGERLGYVKDKE